MNQCKLRKEAPGGKERVCPGSAGERLLRSFSNQCSVLLRSIHTNTSISLPAYTVNQHAAATSSPAPAATLVQLCKYSSPFLRSLFELRELLQARQINIRWFMRWLWCTSIPLCPLSLWIIVLLDIDVSSVPPLISSSLSLTLAPLLGTRELIRNRYACLPLLFVITTIMQVAVIQAVHVHIWAKLGFQGQKNIIIWW